MTFGWTTAPQCLSAKKKASRQSNEKKALQALGLAHLKCAAVLFGLTQVGPARDNARGRSQLLRHTRAVSQHSAFRTANKLKIIKNNLLWDL